MEALGLAAAGHRIGLPAPAAAGCGRGGARQGRPGRPALLQHRRCAGRRRAVVFATSSPAGGEERPKSFYERCNEDYDVSVEKLDSGCSEPLVWGGREEEERLRKQMESANAPGGNPMRSADRDANRLDNIYSGATAPAPQRVRDVRTPPEGRCACTRCRGTGFLSCGTCGGSGLYVEPTTESAGVINYVPCMECGGDGDTLCDACGGRAHIAAG